MLTIDVLQELSISYLSKFIILFWSIDPILEFLIITDSLIVSLLTQGISLNYSKSSSILSYAYGVTSLDFNPEISFASSSSSLYTNLMLSNIGVADWYYWAKFSPS